MFQMVFGNCGVLTEMGPNKSYVEMTGIDAETSQDIAEVSSWFYASKSRGIFCIVNAHFYGLCSVRPRRNLESKTDQKSNVISRAADKEIDRLIYSLCRVAQLISSPVFNPLCGGMIRRIIFYWTVFERCTSRCTVQVEIVTIRH